MRKVNIRWRWFRRLVNIWIESAKYHPETEQRIGIVNKIMQEGEPKNWDKDHQSPPVLVFPLSGKSIVDELQTNIDFTKHPALQPDDGLSAFGIRYGERDNTIVDLETRTRRYQYPATPGECFAPIDVAALTLCRDKEYRRVYRSDTGAFMGYLVGVSLANQCNKMDAVEIEPIPPTFTHWHPLTHVKFEA